MAEAGRCARIVVAELLAGGVREVVLSPGSRSAPLAYELLNADRIGLLRLHVRIDERGAGFLALGLAKASELPVAVVTTSGTAVANLHPAVLEAWHSRVPLIAVTADRPAAAIHSGANQTTEQRGLFAPHVRAQVTIDDRPGLGARDSDWWQFEVARLVTAATGARSGQAGPVHLNVALSDPLVPDLEEEPPVTRELRIEPRRFVPEAVVLPAGPQTVIVAGDLPPAAGVAVAALAAGVGVPLLAEPSSNARVGAAAIGSYRVLLDSSLGQDVERVVVFGRPTLSRPVQQLLGRDDVELVVVAQAPEWIDPQRRADRIVDAVELEPGDADWLRRWTDADQQVRSELDRLLDRLLDRPLDRPLDRAVAGPGTVTGPQLAEAVWTGCGRDDVLVAGSSSPIRDLDLAPITSTPPTVYANRGLAGIDGTLSTAAGIAIALERPVHALVGDETFLHDLTALVTGSAELRPDLRIVVADDNGGSIFATLEHGRPAYAGAYERIFGTPHGVDLVAVSTALGATACRVTTLTDLVEVLQRPPRGIEVVAVTVDRSQRRNLNAAVTGLAASL